MAAHLRATECRPARVSDRHRRRLPAGSGQSTPRTRAVRRQVGDRVARVRRPGLARVDRRRRPGRAGRAALPTARRARSGAPLFDPRAAGRRRAAARRPRRPGVRGIRRPDAVPRCDELGRTDSTDARCLDPARRPRRDVFGLGALRRRSRPRAAPADRRARTAREAHRHGRQPGRARDAARAASPPEVLRRPLSAVGQLLPPALGQRGVGLRPLPADHALRRHGAARRLPRASRPVTITCGTSEENRSNNRAMADALAAQGYPTASRGDPATATRGRVGAMPSIPNLPALIEAVS